MGLDLSQFLPESSGSSLKTAEDEQKPREKVHLEAVRFVMSDKTFFQSWLIDTFLGALTEFDCTLILVGGATMEPMVEAIKKTMLISLPLSNKKKLL